MKDNARKIIGNMLDKIILGRVRLQPIFENLFSLSLVGMNCGNAANFKISGELNLLRFIHVLLEHKRKIVLFDVGAHIGEYSSFLNKIFKDIHPTIFSFEPSKKTFEILQRNLSKFQNIYLNNIGFSDIVGDMKLYTNRELSGQNSLYKRDLQYLNQNMSISERVSINTLDKFCAKNNIDSIDFLKLDVEGDELKVLHGAKDLLEKGKIKFIQFEFGAPNIDSRTYFKDFFYLLNTQYKIYRVVKNGIFPINKYRSNFEMFGTTNYFAELRERNYEL